MTGEDQEQGNGRQSTTEIPADVQDVSTEELVANDYNVDFGDRDIPGSEPVESRFRTPQPGSFDDPGRTRHDNSIDASSDETDRTDEGYRITTGYESRSATRVGKPDDPDYDSELDRINEGRDRSDGSLSKRQSEWDKKRIAEAICS
jgi:hypothetical protein